MSLVRRTSPWGDMLSLRQAMDRLFEESFVRPRSFLLETIEGHGPPLDAHETADELVVEAALPGVKPDDVEIMVSGDTLTISGKTSFETKTEERDYLFHEIRRGSFSRSVTLPANLRADRAKAHFEHGILRLAIPKAEEAKPRQIRITTTGDAPSDVPVEAGQKVGATAGNGR